MKISIFSSLVTYFIKTVAQHSKILGIAFPNISNASKRKYDIFYGLCLHRQHVPILISRSNKQLTIV